MLGSRALVRSITFSTLCELGLNKAYSAMRPGAGTATLPTKDFIRKKGRILRRGKQLSAGADRTQMSTSQSQVPTSPQLVYAQPQGCRSSCKAHLPSMQLPRCSADVLGKSSGRVDRNPTAPGWYVSRSRTQPVAPRYAALRGRGGAAEPVAHFHRASCPPRATGSASRRHVSVFITVTCHL